MEISNETDRSPNVIMDYPRPPESRATTFSTGTSDSAAQEAVEADKIAFANLLGLLIPCLRRCNPRASRYQREADRASSLAMNGIVLFLAA